MTTKINACDLVDSHKPKDFKFFFDIKDTTLIQELEVAGYDISSLNTIIDEDLIQAALTSDFTDKYDRDIIGRANEPTIFEDGIIMSKQLITKTDKKLESILKSIFIHNSIGYVAWKYQYERFDIIQIFVLI